MLENAGGFHENHEPGRWAIRQNKMKQRFLEITYRKGNLLQRIFTCRDGKGI